MSGGYIGYRGNSLRLVIKDKSTLLKVIHLIYGNMRTPKIEALHRLIEWVNKYRLSQVIKLPLDTSPLSNNSWLSGMIDADGNFYLNWSLDKKIFLLVLLIIYVLVFVNIIIKNLLLVLLIFPLCKLFLIF